MDNRPIIEPSKIFKKLPDIKSKVIIILSHDDVRIAKRNGLLKEGTSFLFSNLFASDSNNLSVVGPAVGAPAASIILEAISTKGAKEIICVGLCGSICKDFKIGDIVILESAISDEGVSKSYSGSLLFALPDPRLREKVKSLFKKFGIHFKNGVVWSTDAIFMETPKKIKKFLNMGACLVDMEMSALFNIGMIRGVSVTGVCIVSDELHDSFWKPGFYSEMHKKSLLSVLSCLILGKEAYLG